MVSDVTLSGTLSDVQKTQSQSVKLAEDFDDFLTLLTTQLKNQDPLNPMDSTEFTNQLVQFSQVEQAINTNQKLNDMLSLQLASIASVALGYVGMDVSYRSADLNFDGETPVKISYALSEAATQAKISILDEAGQVVFSTDGGRAAGRNDFTWDGRTNNGTPAPDGTYSVRVAAINGEGKSLETSTVVTGRVRGIESQDGVIYLLIGDRAVAINAVINASVPEETAEAPVPPDEEDPDDTTGGTA